MRTMTLSGLALLALITSVTRADERPNILFCFADDWGQYASAYRTGADDPTPNAVVNTPNVDRVAREGVLFRNAFVNAPSCTPCRSALLSGQYFYRTGRGAILQGAVWDASIPSFPLILRDAGYRIGYMYKVWGPGSPTNAPIGANETKYDGHGTRFNQFSQNVSQAADHAAEKQKLLDEVRGNFTDFLADRSAGQPFCFWFGPTNCHRKWVKGSGKDLWGLNPDNLKGKLPPFLPDNEVIRQDFCDYLGEVQAFDAGVGVLLDELEQRGELDRTLVVISGDHGIPGFPRGKCNLYDFGVRVALAVRWPQQIPPSRVLDDFVNLMDLAPTFLEAGGETPPKVMTGRSLMPALKSAGEGQVDPTRDYVVVGRERHVAAARTDNLPYPQRALRTKDFLYIRNFRPERWPMGTGPGYGEPAGPIASFDELTQETFLAFGDMDASPTKAWIVTHRSDEGVPPFFDIAFGLRPGEELYDLTSDPQCMHNLAEDSAHAVRKAVLSGRLMDILTQTGDPRVIDNGRKFESPPFTNGANNQPTRVRRGAGSASPVR